MIFKDLSDALRRAPGDTLLQAAELFLSPQSPTKTPVSVRGKDLGIAFCRRRLDVIRLLLDHGADPRWLGWNDMHTTVAVGTIDEVTALISSFDSSARTDEGHTPFLLACYVGDVDKAEALLAVSSMEDRYSTPKREPALIAAVQGQSPTMVKWLLSVGFDPNEPSEFGKTALMQAVEVDTVDIVKLLLDSGADVSARYNLSASERRSRWSRPTTLKRRWKRTRDRPDRLLSAASFATGTTVAWLLVEAGCDVNELGPRVLLELTGASFIPPQNVTRELFETQKGQRFGLANPELAHTEYWLEVIRTRRGGWFGRKKFGVPREDPPAVWSFDRYGRTTTRLSDGRWIQIAGEHEDWYDPDFCIYNDVVVYDGKGGADIYIYPRELFPPTDFHTATLHEDEIYLIGNLGYVDERQVGTTQVLALSLRDFSIKPVQTTGDLPGWISRHRAALKDGEIIIEGGEIWDGNHLQPNKRVFALSLATRSWRIVDAT